MSTLQATNLKHNASASNNIVLDASGNTTVSGNATISGSATVGGVAVVTTTGTQTLTNKTLGSPLTMGTSVLTLMTAQNSTSGTFIDFTGIPSWVRRVTVMFNGVSTTTTSAFLIQVGAGSFATTGYAGGAMSIEGTNATSVTTTGSGFLALRGTIGAAAAALTGHLVITNISGNTWVGSGSMVRTDNGVGTICSGSISLGGVLDRVRITTSTGTDVFDAGSINVLYE